MYMISFKIINSENKDEIYEALAESFDKEGREALFEIVESLPLFELEDVEYAITASHGCLLMRIFDMGRYLFAFPYEISGDADIELAIDDLVEYARREEVSLVLTDVPIEAFSLLSGFRHMDVDCEDDVGTVYRVRIKTECELISEIPESEYGRVKLNAITDEDVELYARLCKSKNVNKYWGYDYSADIENPLDAYFLENARREFSLGVSISFAIRAAGFFCGEAVIYAFDGRGGAEFAVRLLPEWQGQGLGKDAVRATMNAARKIGLTHLNAKIMSENSPSHSMVRTIMTLCASEDGAEIYECRL